MRRDRLLADFLEIAPLEFALEGDPFLPGLLERDAEHLLELVGVVALAAFVAPDPGDDFLGRIGVGEPSDEPRAVEVGVRRRLEADPNAARREPQRIVEVARRRAPSPGTPSRRSRLARDRLRRPSTFP